jgi:3-hydroxybutyryl-CoA dehydrogenase
MQVYTLPETADIKILLTGDTDFVVEFAALLDSRNIPFNIVPPMDELDELDMELDIVDQAVGEAALDADLYGPFAKRVIGDVRNEAGTFTHIVDLSVASPMERRATIEVTSTVNPKATVVVSSLTNTATEMGAITSTTRRIVGVGLSPNIISSATRIDLAGGLNTQPKHVEQAQRLFRTLGYDVDVVEDRVGLVQMRMLAMLINEAAFAVMEGLATPEDIDLAMTLGVNYPKGLLAWADEIGIPVVVLILDGLYREYQQERYRPCVLLKQYLRAGWHGKASGRGFYKY